MSAFTLPIAAVKLSERSIIQDSLPEGFGVSGNGPLYGIMALASGGVTCAVASICDGRIAFNIEKEGYSGFWGSRFINELLAMYPVKLFEFD